MTGDQMFCPGGFESLGGPEGFMGGAGCLMGGFGG